jgi:hypothetical protein
MAEPYTKCADAQSELDQNFFNRSNRRVNGSEPTIEIFKPLDEAFQLMKKILFRPFDLKKWFVIGFAAWLSNLGGGSYNFRFNRGDWKNVPWFQDFSDTISEIPHWILWSGLFVIIVLMLALIIVFGWLRARGRFMFVDCIVKNRGAIVEPWREFREQGNSYFLLALLAGFIIAVIAGISSLPFMLPIIRGVTFLHLHDVYLICMIALWAVVLVLLILAWSLISHFMVAVMYRRRCRAGEAFLAALSLIANYPGEITFYCLFWIVLGIASAIAACATVLATCCMVLIPYIGTVILLPLFVCLRAFGLRFIRQFGPDYDVWAGLPAESPTPSSMPPPLPS